MLVIVENRNVQLVYQAFLDLEAPGSRDVLKVYPAKARCYRLDDFDDLVGVSGVQSQRPCIDPAELLEEKGLAFHHR